jgi:hypothetical protein
MVTLRALGNAPEETVMVSPLSGSPGLWTVSVPPEGGIAPFVNNVSNDDDGAGVFVPVGELELLHAAMTRMTTPRMNRRTRCSQERGSS